jgi:hypothetical protein
MCPGDATHPRARDVQPGPATCATARAPPAARGRRAVVFFAAALCAAVGIRLALAGGPRFSNDSYQYLSVADNLQRNGAIATSIVHFDTERATGRVPAPATTFAPGYPMLIAALSWTRVPPEWCGLLVSFASSLIVLVLLQSAARTLGFTPVAAYVCLSLWAFSAQVSLYATSVLTESVFTAMSLAAVALVLKDERHDRAGAWRIPAACLLTGFAYWMRYAGLFLVAALHLHALARMRRDRVRRWHWLVSLTACDALVAAVMLRNVWVAGTWRGGNTREVHHGPWYVVRRFGVGAYELAFGSLTEPTSVPFGLLASVTVVGAAAVLVVAARALAGGRREYVAHTSGLTLLTSWLAVYCAGMFYLGLTSDVSVGGRMLVPTLPVAALLAGTLVTASTRLNPGLFTRVPTAALVAVFVLGYAGVNALSVFGPPRPSKHRLIAEQLDLPMSDGAQLSSWIRTSVPQDAVLVSVEGQATGHLLKRPTISAGGHRFTDLAWDEGATRQIMSQFGAEYLVVYPGVVEDGADDAPDSVFFRQLASGRAPGWLEVAAKNRGASIYRARWP